jgi:hypothetical protein
MRPETGTVFVATVDEMQATLPARCNQYATSGTLV